MGRDKDGSGVCKKPRGREGVSWSIVIQVM